MSKERYQIEWCYLGELPYPGSTEQAHCEFLIRFPDIPFGEDHCAFFCVNVISNAIASKLLIPSGGRRGFIVKDTLSREEFMQYAEASVAEAFLQKNRIEALNQLDLTFIWRDRSFETEFQSDILPSEELKILIKRAFSGVKRGQGMTMHQALAIDDYGSLEEVETARQKDTDQDWSDIPFEILADPAMSVIFSYLDDAGFKYYLPAAMTLSLDPVWRSESYTPERTYSSLFPCIAPRDFGKGFSHGFDVDKFIEEKEFSEEQVGVIYRFLCFMAIEGGQGVTEEQLPVMRRWRERAKIGGM